MADAGQTPPGPSPGRAVGLEFARALGGVLLLPLRIADYLVCNGELRHEFAEGLDREAAVEDVATLPEPPRDRPLRVFVSCAEVSGELHGKNFVHALRSRLEELGAPAPELTGLGSERLAALGVRTVGDPVSRAAMGFDGMFKALPYYLGLLRDAAAAFRAERPDVVVLVDSPALHVPLARIAKRYDLKVVHYVTPQFWAWAPWRTAPYSSVVDRALSILPFEPDWFGRREVPVAHVGHPLLDALEGVPRATPEMSNRTLALLPGSRAGVIERNLPWMLDVAARLRRKIPELEVVIAQQETRFEAEFQRHIDATGTGAFARIETGDLHGTLARCGVAFTVSGTVLLDLLHHRLPTVVVYRLGTHRDVWLSRYLLSTPWFASVNLIAGREVLPEFHFAGAGPVDEVCAALERCYDDPAWLRQCRHGLDLAAARLGPPGASQRAADQALLTALGGLRA
jgi:lipid-A-disaccharide synthase